jgi:hypothetical protein
MLNERDIHEGAIYLESRDKELPLVSLENFFTGREMGKKTGINTLDSVRDWGYYLYRPEEWGTTACR